MVSDSSCSYLFELFSINVDHNPPSQPKEDSIGQNHHQEEIIHKLAVRLRNIGDSIEQRMVQEVRLKFPQQGPSWKEQTEQWLPSSWNAQELAEHMD